MIDSIYDFILGRTSVKDFWKPLISVMPVNIDASYNPSKPLTVDPSTWESNNTPKNYIDLLDQVEDLKRRVYDLEHPLNNG